MTCAVAQHEKAAGRSLTHPPLPIFSAATWMTSFILQNFYCTLQVCADNQCHACHGWLHAPGQGTCLCMTYVRWVIALASAAHRAASTMVIHLLRTQNLPWRPIPYLGRLPAWQHICRPSGPPRYGT